MAGELQNTAIKGRWPIESQMSLNIVIKYTPFVVEGVVTRAVNKNIYFETARIEVEVEKHLCFVNKELYR